ncbi:zinc finger, C2H2 type protein [Rhizoctonia solani 123E]|uniref:Zinc finger, C2H2 type protein n=1 Tax=Rhizoctonia solani 123E TaxID=1423351 RepID=A0A074SMK3_9AGAM|nr:zinc finger, C2H2 type protein [Rhizoctonia solani 123E]
MECYIAGAQYFAIDQQLYAFNTIHGLVFPVDDTCEPLHPILHTPAPGESTQICGINLRTTYDKGLEYCKDHSHRWEPVKLFPTYGDACEVSVNPSLFHSLVGFELERDEDEEELFRSYGWPPTRQSIDQWVEDRKTCHAPNVCPMKDCKQELRRPHALKDHLFFKFEIKDYKCDHRECGRSFATKTNYSRHMKGCAVGNN